MKGKLLENIVLAIGLLVIGAAVFLMFFAETPEIAKSVNIIFATGFIIYIMYNHIMARNLNGEIYDLKKHVSNLKEEIGRLESTLQKRNQTIGEQKETINSQQLQLEEAAQRISEAETKLKDTLAKVAELEARLQEEENS